MVAQDVRDIAKRAREASWKVQSIDTEKKNKALAVIKAKLSERREDILNANKKDLEEAAVQVAKGKLSSTLVKRLDLAGKDFGKFNDLLTGLDDVAALEDPVGKVTLARRLDEGLDMYRVACPVGVICIIFEARPECCVQISSLCLKSGNAVILKGGKEAHHSNQALVKVLQEALATAGIPEGMVQLVETREEVAELLSMDEYIDLVIPRGSNALVKYVKNNTRIPVLGHADGLCSIFLDQSADVAKAVSVVVDAKTNYPAACNSTETLLVHSSVLSTVLPLVGAGLAAAGVQMKADERCLSHLPSANTMAAIPDDFHTEFLDLTIAVKAVDSLEEAVNHVNTHGSHHTDCIVTEDKANAEWFMSRIDSAGVYHNASTRFADGFRYGFGAEIGVSTNKTHARGPVGLEGLLIYKYRMYGNGQGAGMYGKDKQYMHTDITDGPARF